MCLRFREMPSSFKGSVGKIVYSLEARLSRSLRIDKTDTVKLNFVSNADMSADPQLMVCADTHLHTWHSNRGKKRGVCVLVALLPYL